MSPLILKRTVKNIPLLEVVLEELRDEKIPIVIYYHGWQTSKELVLTQGRKFAKKGIRVFITDAMNHGERNSQCLLSHPILFGVVFMGIYSNLVH